MFLFHMQQKMLHSPIFFFDIFNKRGLVFILPLHH